MNWQAAAEWMLRTIAPDDSEGAVYIIDFADLQADHDFDAIDYQNTLAFTHRRLDVNLQPWLEATRQWRGRGFACVIRRDKFKTTPDLLGAVAHEFAHGLDVGIELTGGEDSPLDKLPMPAAMTLSRLLTERIATRIPPWFQHEERFVRAAAHLAYRVGGIVESVRPKHLRFASPYLPQPYTEGAFMDALSDELRRSGCIRDILASEPPTAFSERWQQATGL